MNPTDSKFLLPFNLKRFQNKKVRTINWIPILDLCVIACLLGFLRTEIIFSPGLELNLPKSETFAARGISTSSVLTITKSKDSLIFLFENRIFNGFSEWNNYLESMHSFKSDSPVLLIKTNASTELLHFLKACEIAEKNGFKKILIASDNPE